MPKFKHAQKKAKNPIISAVLLNPYASVNMPPSMGAIADPTANAMLCNADALSVSSPLIYAY